LEYRRIGLLTEDWLTPYVKPAMFWLACFALCSIVTVGIATQEVDIRRFILLGCLFQFAGLLLVPYALHACRDWLLDWGQSVDAFVKPADKNSLVDWYNKELAFFEGSKKTLVMGFLFGLISVSAFVIDGYLDGFTEAGAVWLAFIILVSGSLAGCGLWIMYRGAAAVSSLGHRYKDCVVVTRSRFGVLSTGRVLAQCWMIIGGVWFVFTLTAVIRPAELLLPELLLTYPVLLLALPTFPVIVGCFIACQLPMHEAMLRYKRRECARTEAMLRAVAPEDSESLTKERRESIDFLSRQCAELDKLPEWPFSSAALAGVGGSSITAVLPVLAKSLVSAELFEWLIS